MVIRPVPREASARFNWTPYDSPSTIRNLYNFSIPGYQLSSSLLAIVSQRLIREICPYCRVTFAADEKVLLGLELDPDEHRNLRLQSGLGCPTCF